MPKLSILLPDATVNYIENPNSRYDITGYNALSATLTRSLDYARFGIASCQVVTSGLILREGVYYRVNSLQGISEVLTASVYVIGTGRVRVRLIDNPTGKEYASETATLLANRFTRLSATGMITGSNDVRLYVETNEGSAKARTFYVGGLQLERKAYPTTFCDGDQPGCTWTGVYHASRSQRLADTRAGGRWVQLLGTKRQEQNLYMTVVSGLGMPDISNNTQSFALTPGSSFQNKKVKDRLITMSFHAKHSNLSDRREDCEASQAELHQLRQLLIDAVKPDLTGGDEDIWWLYEDGVTALSFQARYDGGLEGSWDVRNEWINSFPMRLLAVSPAFYEDQQGTQQIDFQNTMLFNFVMARINGTWSNLNSGVNGQVACAAIGPKGQVYIAGVFSVANNAAGALSPTIAARVAYWDGEKWVAIATALAGATAQIIAIAIRANGNVIVGGDFTSINGTSANYIAEFNGSAWSAFGTGMNAAVRGLAVAPNGDVYAVGDFTTAGGVSCARVARWDTQWRRVGQYGGLNNPAWCVAINQEGTILYVGGEFTDQNGLAANALVGVTKYDISSGQFSAMGSGLSGGSVNRVRTLRIAPSGVVYAGGNFTTSGTTTVTNVAQWNGGSWVAMGTGLDRQVINLDYFSDGTLLAVGQFNNAGTLPVSKIALWNGSTWVLFDNFFRVTLTDQIDACAIDRRSGNVFFGFGSNVGTGKEILFSGSNTINNLGSMETSPIFYLLGPGKLRWIENQTNKKRMYLNLDLLSNEEVFIDIGRGTILSTVRGNLLFSLLGSSDFRGFSLLPGNNSLAIFMYDDVAAKIQVTFTPQHWSVDAVQNVESL